MTNAEQKRIFARNLDRLIVKSGHTRQEVADALGFNYLIPMPKTANIA